MKTSLRIDSRIEVYRNRIIIPRQVAEISDKGMSVSYAATVINEEDTMDVYWENLRVDDTHKDLDELIKQIKKAVDKAIDKYENFVQKESDLPKDIFEVLEQAIKGFKS